MTAELFPDLQQMKKRLLDSLKDISTVIGGTAQDAVNEINKFIAQLEEKDRRIAELEKQLDNVPQMEKRDLYAVWTNTDLTEGRGMEYPFAICIEESTALRLALGKGVQGHQAPVTKVKAFRFNNWVHAPVRVHQPTPEDLATQKKIDTASAVIAKARAAGLTNEEINALRNV